MKTQLRKRANGISSTNNKLDVLHRVTTALLDEVKSLSTLKMIDLTDSVDFDDEVKRFEIFLIERALRLSGGSQRGAARILRLKATTLHAKIKRYGINVGKEVNGFNDSPASDGLAS